MKNLQTLERAEQNVLIQQYILKNYKELDTYEMANKLGIEPFRVAGNKAFLKRSKQIGEGEKTHQWSAYTTKAREKKKEASIEVAEPKKRGRKPKDDKNTYKNETGANKAIAREKMANIIIKSGVQGIVPTLPNTNWAIELMIEKSVKGNSFLGVERNPLTFKKMRTNLKQLRKNNELSGETHLGNIAEVIFGKNENSYAHLILDYCGNLVTIRKELEYAIQNNVVAVGGVMAVTFAKPIRGIDAESLKLLDLAVENNTDSRCASDKAIEAYFYKITGFTHKVVEFFHYRDTSPMTLVLIKRIK